MDKKPETPFDFQHAYDAIPVGTLLNNQRKRDIDAQATYLRTGCQGYMSMLREAMDANKSSFEHRIPFYDENAMAAYETVQHMLAANPSVRPFVYVGFATDRCTIDPRLYARAADFDFAGHQSSVGRYYFISLYYNKRISHPAPTPAVPSIRKQINKKK